MRSLTNSRITAAALLVLAALSSGCATTGSTFGSGVGDRYLEHAPYYAGAPRAAIGGDGSRIAHFPIAYQRGGSQSEIFDPAGGKGSAIGKLLQEMNGFLDSLGVTVRIAAAETPALLAPPRDAVPPDVHFGCATESGAPGDDCAEREGALGRKGQTMKLAVGRPSQSWIGWASGYMHGAAAPRALVITLEVGQYLTRQRGLLGSKEVELGTDHTEKLPWLTSLETPVTVLQLTGAVVDTSGKALRIGAEGIFARRTRLLVSSIGGQELLSDADVERVRTLRRDDIPGEPLAWRVALSQLVEGLTGVRIPDHGVAGR
jgi:hypothetical protein